MQMHSILALASGSVLGLALAASTGCAQGSADELTETTSGEWDPSGTAATGEGGASATTAGPATTTSGAGASGPTSTSGGDGGSATASGTTSSSGSSGVGGGAGAGGSGLDGTATTMLSVFGGANSSSIVGNSQDFVTSMGWANPFTDQTAERVGLAFTGSGKGIAVVRSAGTGELRYAMWTGNWFPGFGSPLQAVEANLTVAGGPAIVAGGADKAFVAYRKDDSKLYFAAVQSGLWSPTQETIGSGVDQSSGPAAPAIAAPGGDPMALFVGDDGDLYDRTRSGGLWQAPHAHGLAGTVAPITPAVIALASGPELLAVFADAATHGLVYATLSAGTWSAPVAIPNAASDETVSLAALPSLGAAIAYRRIDGTLGALVFSPADQPPWSEPTGLAPTNLIGVPAIAGGAVGARAELMYVDTQALVYASRLVNGAWTAPLLAGSSGERIAIATGL